MYILPKVHGKLDPADKSYANETFVVGVAGYNVIAGASVFTNPNAVKQTHDWFVTHGIFLRLRNKKPDWYMVSPVRIGSFIVDFEISAPLTCTLREREVLDHVWHSTWFKRVHLTEVHE